MAVLFKQCTCRLCDLPVSYLTSSCLRCTARFPAFPSDSIPAIALLILIGLRVLLSYGYGFKFLGWIDWLYFPFVFYVFGKLPQLAEEDKPIIERRRYDPNKVYPTWQEVAAEHRAQKSKKTTEKSDVLSFVYEDADGNVSTRNIVNWQEDDVYFEGFCLDRNEVRTFKKERVLSYLDDSERFLKKTNPVVAEFKKSNKRVNSSEILFTGFGKVERAKLEELARHGGLTVCQSATVGLDYICTGKNAGPAKLAQALANGAIELSVDEFYQLVKTGEIPNY